MMRAARLAALLSLAVLSGCSGYLPHLRVIRANYNISRGEYQPAIVDYLRARENEQFDPWLAYNLGNVYHLLGESGAALDEWRRAGDSDVPDLLFGAAFNSGVYFLEQGDLLTSRERFRFALRIEPQSLAAKRNLEVVLERLEAERDVTRSTPQTGSSGAPSVGEPAPASNRLLDYMRRREEQRWRAQTSEQAEDGVRDW